MGLKAVESGANHLTSPNQLALLLNRLRNVGLFKILRGLRHLKSILGTNYRLDG